MAALKKKIKFVTEESKQDKNRLMKSKEDAWSGFLQFKEMIPRVEEAQAQMTKAGQMQAAYIAEN